MRFQAIHGLEIRNRLQTFEGFVREVRPSFQWYHHCDKLGQALQGVANGTIKRLMVFEPPRHGKSEEASRLFPAYYLSQHPTHHFGITSYAAELAYGLNRDARDNYLTAGNRFKGSSEGMVEWHTDEDGRCWASGVGGPITGKGGDCLLIDDPFKNEEEAYSASMREKVWQWYLHTFYTRLHPNGAIILICTRWHADDLAGRLLAEERTSTHPEHWHILSFEAIKQAIPQDFPPTCTVIDDWRKPGEALCPERYDIPALENIKAKSDVMWRALYQQTPIEEGGNIWKLIWFKKFGAQTNGVRFSYDGCDWDLAYGDEKNEENAASAFIRSKLGSDGNIYVFDCGFEWYDFPKQIEWMKGFEAPHFVENKGPGKSAVQALIKGGTFAQEVKIKGGDKVARTILATPMAQQGRIYIHEDIWDKLLFDERQGILGFPSRPFNDLNDAFTQMIHRLWPYAEKVQPKEQGNARTIEEIEQPEYIQANIFDKLKKKAAQKTHAIRL